MSLVPESQDPGPRVLPKVFADVPSAAELARAHVDLAAARAGRTRATIFSVLLLGMLIATVGGLVYLQMETQDLPATIERMTTEKKELTDSLANLEESVEALKAQHEEDLEEYRVVSERIERNASLRADIEQLLKEREWARKKLTAAERSTAFESSVWLTQKAAAEAALKAETEALQAIAEKVKNTPKPQSGIF